MSTDTDPNTMTALPELREDAAGALPFDDASHTERGWRSARGERVLRQARAATGASPIDPRGFSGRGSVPLGGLVRQLRRWMPNEGE